MSYEWCNEAGVPAEECVGCQDCPFRVGDVVDWKVIGAGGSEGRYLGTLRCTVVHAGIELGLRPLDWEKARNVLTHELTNAEFNDAIQDRGFIDCCQPEDCTLVDPEVFALGPYDYRMVIEKENGQRLAIELPAAYSSETARAALQKALDLDDKRVRSAKSQLARSLPRYVKGWVERRPRDSWETFCSAQTPSQAQQEDSP